MLQLTSLFGYLNNTAQRVKDTLHYFDISFNRKRTGSDIQINTHYATFRNTVASCLLILLLQFR